MKKVISIIYIVIGVGIIGLWIMLLSTNQVPELETELASIVFHIVIELTMAMMCIITGLSLIRKYSWSTGVLLVTNGMLIYSVINSSGYYVELQNYGMVGMFFVIFIFVFFTSYYKIKT